MRPVQALIAPFCSVSYQYYYLPFCKPSEGIEQKLEDLGEVLEGDRMTSTEYDLPFRVDKEHEKLCSRTLTVEEVQKFRQAINDDFYFQVSRLVESIQETSTTGIYETNVCTERACTVVLTPL